MIISRILNISTADAVVVAYVVIVVTVIELIYAPAKKH